MIKKFILLLSLAALLEGCSIWPYKSDFDCPIPEGNSCRSLHEINQMADLGAFSIDHIKTKGEKQEQRNHFIVWENVICKTCQKARGK